MKRSTKDKLLAYIASCVYDAAGNGNTYNLQQLYRFFSMLEIEKLSDIEKTEKEFLRFIDDNEIKILKSMRGGLLSFWSNTRELSKRDLYDFYGDYNLLKSKFDWYNDPELRYLQNIFVALVREFISGNNCTVAEVGSGPIPVSSFKIADFAKDVYSFDKFLLTAKFMKQNGVNAYDRYFTSETPVDSYDILVGNSPCGGIRPMVEAAAKSNTPYFIGLCDCDLKNQKMPDGSKVSSWKQLLPIIDPRVKFYKEFAYTIDATHDQIDRALARAVSIAHQEKAIDDMDDFLNIISSMKCGDGPGME